LSEWDPLSVIHYKWLYSFSELIKFYQRKQKIYFDRTSANLEFLVSLTQAALGGKRQSAEGEIEASLDDGEGLDELTDEQIANLKQVLGKDFASLYPDYAEDEPQPEP
jgi:hypothetical protein